MADYKWLLYRLKAMSPTEIIYRVYKKAYHEIERMKYVKNKKTILDYSISNNEYTQNKYFYFNSNRAMKDLYVNNFAESLDNLLAKADDINNYKFNVLGVGAIKFEKSVNWYSGITSNESWPKIYKSDIEFKNRDEIGDIRLTWEINRHHHLVILSKAYMISNNEKYFISLKEQFHDWVEKNPIGIGPNWASAMELAIRVQNWIWCYFYLKDFTNAKEINFKNTLVKAINQHCNYIKKNLALYSSANNHLLVECVTLCIAGILFPKLKESSKWIKVGLYHLRKNLPKQVYTDGVNAEQAVHYQAFVMEALILLVVIARKNSIFLPLEIEDSLTKMAHYIRHLINNDGTVPALGDSDDGHIINLVGEYFNDYESLLNQVAILKGNPEFKLFDHLDEQTFWIFGEESFSLYNEIQKGEITSIKSKVFHNGGLSILRSERDSIEAILTFDHGPLGFGTLSAHGHADALSITLGINGKQLLVDPGTYIYNIKENWRNYFRSTQIHNTVTLNNKNQSEIKGPFLWGKKAHSELLSYKLNDEFDFISAMHDGYTPLIHYRSILYLKPDIWLIEDEVTGCVADFLLNYSFNKRIKITENGLNSFIISTNNEKLLYMKFKDVSQSSNVEVKVEDIYISGKFGSKSSSKALRFKSKDSQVTKVYTFITVNPSYDMEINNNSASIFYKNKLYKKFDLLELKRG
ncbi:MAG: alginate lyase family protein [Bacillota bacterium]